MIFYINKYIVTNLIVIVNIILLTAFLYLYYNYSPYLYFYLLFFLLFITFYSEKYFYGSTSLNNLILLLFFLYTLYGIFDYILFLILESKNIINYKSSIIYFSGLIGLSFGRLFVYKYQSYSILKKRSLNMNLIFIFLFLAIGFRSIYMIFNNTFFNFNRLINEERNDLLKPDQLWVISGYLISGFFLYVIFNYKNYSRKSLNLIIFVLIYYILLQLSIGNRRDFLSIIIAILYMYFKKKDILISFKTIFLGSIFIFSFLFIGTLRDLKNPEIKLSDKVVMTLQSNEFVYPFQTLTTNVSKYYDENLQLKYGKTIFLNSFIIYIPRFLLSSKPNSLGTDFIQTNFDGGQGFAYMPSTEFFINFGILGPFFGMTIIGFIFNSINILKHSSIKYLFYCLVPDFCRGEISTFIYQLLFISFLFLLPIFFNKNVKNEVV
jgi:oligosaccharide repeat unit polymerase